MWGRLTTVGIVLAICHGYEEKRRIIMLLVETKVTSVLAQPDKKSAREGTTSLGAIAHSRQKESGREGWEGV